MEEDFVFITRGQSQTMGKDITFNYGARANTFGIDATGRWCAFGGWDLQIQWKCWEISDQFSLIQEEPPCDRLGEANTGNPYYSKDGYQVKVI